MTSVHDDGDIGHAWAYVRVFDGTPRDVMMQKFRAAGTAIAIGDDATVFAIGRPIDDFSEADNSITDFVYDMYTIDEAGDAVEFEGWTVGVRPDFRNRVVDILMP